MKKLSLFLLTIVMLTGCVGINHPSPMDIYMQILENEAQQRQGSGQSAPVQFASEDGSLTTEVPSFNAVSKGGDFELTFKTPYSWSAEVVPSTKANSVDWVSLSKNKGNAGQIDIVITVKENETYDSRTAVINIKSGDYTYHIKLFQGQKDAILVAETDVKLGKEAQTYTLHSQTNLESVELVIPTNCDWIKKVSTKGLVDKNFELSISENKTSSTRNAVLTLQNVKSGISQKVTITQDKGEAFLTVSETEFSVGKEGGEIEFIVKWNVKWDFFFSGKEVGGLSIEYLDDNTARCEIAILPNPDSSARVLNIPIIANDYPSLGTELQVSQAAGYNYFYFENLSSTEGTVISLNKEGGSDMISLEYSFNGGYWKELSSDGFNLDFESKVYFRAKDRNDRFYNTGWSTYFSSDSKAQLKVGGNILYLLEKDANVTALNNNVFKKLFQNNTGLKYADDLDLPDFVVISCYENMFDGCSNLKEAPGLPATTLAAGCYSYMFNGCTSLVEAPALPATTLAASCYSYMFNGCTSLVEAPALSAKTVGSLSYIYMFSGCSNLSSVTMLATDISASDCLRDWLKNAGTEADDSVLYVHPSMAGNQTIKENKGKFEIIALVELWLTNGSTKTWTWDVNDTYGFWGQAGSSGNGTEYTAGVVGNYWSGVKSNEDFAGLFKNNAPGGVATGAEDTGAYMIFSSDGTVTSYKANGEVIHSSNFEVTGYNPDRNNNWELGKLTAPGILFPYSINSNGSIPNEFSIMYIDENHLTLVDDKNPVGGWGEITFWLFKVKE